MTFVKTDCPECGERILLDVVNGYGYCMYCGAKVEPEGLLSIPAPVRNTIRRELESDDPYAGKTWYPLVREIGGLMMSGDVSAACSRARDAFALSGSEDESADITDAIDSELIEAVLSVSEMSGVEPYRGGMSDILSITSEHASDELTPMFFELCFMQFGYGAPRIRDIDRARPVIVSIAYVLRDELHLARRPEEIYRALVSAGMIISDLVHSAYPDGANDASYIDDEGIRCYKLAMNLTMMFASEMDGISQKELARINRAAATVDRNATLAFLDEAYARLSDSDPDAYLEPLCSYADMMLPRPAPAKKKARRRSFDSIAL